MQDGYTKFIIEVLLPGQSNEMEVISLYVVIFFLNGAF